MNLVSVSRLERNPTVKTEIKQKALAKVFQLVSWLTQLVKRQILLRLRRYTVPVGDDQEPMLEQTREIVRSFNNIYGKDVLVEPEGYFPPKGMGRIPGLDGNAKMSKSLNNAIYLADDADTIQKKVMSMYTDPQHIRVEDPGHIEGNTVFTYLDIFDPDKEKVQELKDHYQAGGLGDVKIKRYLNEVLQAELKPIRERRESYAADLAGVYQILEEGSQKANELRTKPWARCGKQLGWIILKNRVRKNSGISED